MATTIGQRWSDVDSRPSGFDYLRVSLAVAVTVWHSYQVAYGSAAATYFWANSWLGYLLQLILPMFFALSGFLVAGSMYRNPNLRVFLTLRVIRIYPALAVEVALVALFLGPMLTTVPLREYFSDQKVFLYLGNMLGWIHYRLPGVFLDNPLPEIINSQLWTVPYELKCYVLIAALAIAGFFRLRSRVLPLFMLTTAVVAMWNISQGIVGANPGGWSGLVLLLSFLAGVVLYAYKDEIPWRFDFAIAALLASMFLPRLLDPLVYVIPLAAAYATISLGILNPAKSIVIKSGDYSYGVYLYSCPIQQAVQEALGLHISWFENLLVSLPLVVGFALFSWWCIEKPFMRVKRFVLAPPAPALRAHG